MPVDNLRAEAAQDAVQADWPAGAGLQRNTEVQVAWLLGDDEDGPNGPLSWAVSDG